MRTPDNDTELATGFLFTESIIRGPADVAAVETCGPPAPDSGNHYVIRVELDPAVSVDLGRLQRHFIYNLELWRVWQDVARCTVREWNRTATRH